tara:strand:- start:12567 stop:14552 length:1986 start_codon:yes stop_codon:yes gene_type:complete
MSLIQNFRYRPEIDGLRAIAVLAVILFHADLGVTGGYIGVDVFFVISGYLITSLIVKDLQAGKFSMLDFWERRARRILPASIVAVLFTLLLGWWVLLPSDYVSLAKSAISQGFFAANFYFWNCSDYFAGPAHELPLLHTWSLALEEQFYMVVPVLLLGLFQFSATRRRSFLLVIISLGLVLSLSLSIYTVGRMPAATFYLLPTRAWELLCGAFVAVVPLSWMPKSRSLREGLSWLGFLGILLPCFLYDKGTQFPAAAAIPPCLGAALLILSTSKEERELPLIGRLLAMRPVVFIGLISYSLYLSHWPLFAFSHYWALGPMSIGYRLLLVFVSFLLALLSWRFVETPFRVRRLGKTRSGMFAYAGAGLMVVFSLGAGLIFYEGLPSRYSARVNEIDLIRDQDPWDNSIVKALSLDSAREGRLPTLGVDNSEVKFLVWGDSHARSILPAAVRVANANEATLFAAWNSSTPPLVDYIPPAEYTLGDQAPALAEAVLEHVISQRIDIVLLAAQWSGYFRHEANRMTIGGDFSGVSVADSLIRTVEKLSAVGTQVWILCEVPNHLVDVPKALIHREIFGSDIDSFVCDHESYQVRNSNMDELRPILEARGARFLDLSGFFYDKPSGLYLMEKDGDILYFDVNHLTESGALLAAPGLSALFGNEFVD